jgi:hypothetical protein
MEEMRKITHHSHTHEHNIYPKKHNKVENPARR